MNQSTHTAPAAQPSFQSRLTSIQAEIDFRNSVGETGTVAFLEREARRLRSRLGLGSVH